MEAKNSWGKGGRSSWSIEQGVYEIFQIGMLRTSTLISLIWSQGKQQFHHLMTMLSLNPITLFYWYLINPPMKRFKNSIEPWIKSISANEKSASWPTHSQVNSVRLGKFSSSHSISVIPSLTNAMSWSTGVSVLSDTVAVTHTQVDPVQIKPDPNLIIICDQGLSDHDEISGYECEVVVTSLVKGRNQLNSEVSVLFLV